MIQYYGIPRPEDDVSDELAEHRYNVERLTAEIRLDSGELPFSELMRMLCDFRDWINFWIVRQPDNPRWQELDREADRMMDRAMAKINLHC